MKSNFQFNKESFLNNFHMNNLIQQFFIIGIDEDIIEKKAENVHIKMLSKFPSKIPYCEIKDEVIINVLFYILYI